MTPRPHVTETW